MKLLDSVLTYKSKEYGKQLLAAAVNELAGYDDIFLWVLEENTNARL